MKRDFNMNEIPENFIDQFIEYCKNTTEDQWCVDVVRSSDMKSNCLFGHLFEFAGNDKLGNKYWDHFEANWATTYMVYPVNDGENPDYQQSSAKERCIAYLEDLRDGVKDTTQILMEQDYQNWLNSQSM